MELLRTTLSLLSPQIAVFSPPTLVNPFNDWEEQHVAQGFSWRMQSVSFGTLEEYGTLDLQVKVDSFYELKAKATRIIRVPFHVEENAVAVSNLASDLVIEVPSGDYELIYETGYVERLAAESGECLWCCLTFLATEHPRPAEIIRSDTKLSPGSSLLMEARPAS